ncbi:MAG: MAPEG family protein [Rhodanobacteraceae bacterium]|nr:MAG: MAPEG family protein [Rhodanobacteraceae bacterium]
MPHLPDLVVLLTVLLLLAVTTVTGRARGKYGIKAPAVSGHPMFERAYRVQMNTLEHTLMFLPALWLAARWGNPTWAGILGLVWIVGRAWYIPAYLRDPAARGKPFALAGFALILLIVLAALGVIRLFLLQPL